MNRDEVLGVLTKLKATYPSAYRGMTKEDAEEVVRTWQDTFPGDRAEPVMEAVKAFISANESGFPPSPGQIRALVQRPRTLVSVSQEWARMQRGYKELKEKRHAAGLPATLEKEREMGLCAAEWNTMLEQAGLGVEAVLR